ncbi:hypothetical protein ACWEKR_05970 [Nocardia sp. NPDC004573]
MPDQTTPLADDEVRRIAGLGHGMLAARVAAELLETRQHVAELEAAHAAAKRGHLGWVTGHRHADGKWHIAFDGEPWPSLDEANADVQDASTETPEADWRALAVYAETGEPDQAQEVTCRG